MRLEQYILEQFDGNAAEFGRSIGKHQQQISRWLKMGCIWLDGNVYAPKTNFNREVE